MNCLALSLPGGWEWVLILGIGLLLFGRRLPEVGRSLGQSIVEFKKGVKGVQDEIDSASDEPRPRSESKRRPELQGQTAQYGPGLVEAEKVAPVAEGAGGDDRRVSRDDTV